MAQRRMIDDSFWNSETVAGFDFFQRLFFAGLFCKADDQGRLKAHPALLRSTVFPYDDIPLERITDALDLFQQTNSILIYAVDGTEYIQFLNWWKWQPLKWAWPSRYPAPPDWVDRCRYRQGNTVVKTDWPDDEGDADSVPDETDSTVTPSRNHGETTLNSAPRSRIRSESGSDENQGSISTRQPTGARSPPPVVAVDADSEYWPSLSVLTDVFDHRLADQYARANPLRRVRGWCAYAQKKQGDGPGQIRNPAGFIRAKLDAGEDPPAEALQWAQEIWG